MPKFKTATLTFAVISLTGSAFAADLPLKAPPIAPVYPASTWTGFYVGLNAGGALGVDSTSQNAAFSSTLLGANGLLSSSGRYAPTGAVAGGQIGYNWQVSSWVFGAEADWQWTSQRDSRSACTPPAAAIGFFGAGANGFGYCLAGEQKLTDLGTARLRGGATVNNSLWYVTGGAAWATVKESDSYGGSANPVIFPGALQPGPFLNSAAAFSSTRVGWTLGAGVETRIDDHWSVKLEYLYVDLGRMNESFAIPLNPAFGAAFTAGGAATATSTSRLTDNIFRAGLNYRFNSGAAPLVARY